MRREERLGFEEEVMIIRHLDGVEGVAGDDGGDAGGEARRVLLGGVAGAHRCRSCSPQNAPLMLDHVPLRSPFIFIYCFGKYAWRPLNYRTL